MSIIYAPIIADTIPGFTTSQITIPFRNNPAISMWEAQEEGITLLVKQYNQDTTSFTITTKVIDAINNVAIFDLADKKVEPQTYYKFQIKYGSADSTSPYSSVSIGRCVGNITAVSEYSNMTAKFNITTHITEPIYSYKFIFSDLNNNIIEQSDEIIHNVDKDNINMDNENRTRTAYIQFHIGYLLKENTTYQVQLILTTINNYKLNSVLKFQQDNQLIDIKNTYIQARQSNPSATENGYVELRFVTKEVTSEDKYYTILRSVDLWKWDEIKSFKLPQGEGVLSSTHANLDYIWYDKSIEQGITYTYSLVETRGFKGDYISNICYDAVYSVITADFEHMFLSDNEKQLKIAFNPQMSNFKTVIQEQKQETIGNQFPFVFRNGSVNYKEFPIGGLLSYLMDEDCEFISKNELGLSDNNLTRTATIDRNRSELNKQQLKQTAAERKFKLEILNWLTNGKPKLFRSPTEGNYIVQVMNTSLSPEQKLSRLIHSFSATCYEIDQCTIDNLKKYNLFNLEDTVIAETIVSSKLGEFKLGISKLGGIK